MSVLDMQGVGEPHNGRDAHEDTLLTSHRFASRLAELSGTGKVEQLIVDTLAQVAKADQASLALYEEREGYMAIAATRGYLAELVSDVRAKAGEGLMGDVVSSHLPKIIADVSDEPSAARRRIRYRTPSCLLVPLVASGRLLAVLNLADRYDTIVVFNRIKENGRTLSKQSFAAMANESINEVLVRSLNTNITAMLPILVMLFFGGGTLQDFALALAIGLLVSTYSSIGVASPLYVSWKETEPKFRALKNKYANA